jgi:glycosyltransferase involved in cell wall biosynthesis
MKKQIRIGLVYTGGRSWVGGESYILNIVESLKYYKCTNDNDFSYETILCYDDISLSDHVRTIFKAADDFQYIETVTGAIRRRDQLFAMLNLYIPRRFRFLKPRQRVEIFKSSGIDILYPYDFSKILPEETQAIGWIPDFQPRVMPKYFPEGNLKIRYAIEERIIGSASHIIFSSEDSIADYRHFFPNSFAQAHLYHFHTFVPVSIWADNPINTQKKYCLPDKFFICCNQFWQHKNHRDLFKSIAQLVQNQPDAFFVFTGHTHDHRTPGYFDDLCADINSLSIRNNVAILGLIPKEDQLQLMRRSIGVIQPSLCEGWSTVVEDIRALSKPSILSDLPVHIEQNPAKSQFFDRSDPDSLLVSIAKAWSEWKPGPDLDGEKLARIDAKERIEKMGKDFLDIITASLKP